ncbi:MAG: SpoIIE family protein phosphatase, partial [Bacteroidia bacterium]
LRDSLLNNSNKREALKKQYKYDYDKKLITDSIKSIEQKKITSTQLALQNAEIKNQKTIRIALIIGILVALIFLAFVFNRLRITSKQKKIIQRQEEITLQQKNELELKNKNILESIEAAREIQYIIFPSENELKAIFKDHFMLFKPFDNLSGDFLWVKEVGDKIIVVLGDCTGHGIPASLLTLFANEFLNNIILEKKVTSAAKILEEVNSEIYNYLQRKQKTKKTLNEGMDLAICIVDKKQKQLVYAGSKIDLYTVSNNNELKMAESYTLELGKDTSLKDVKDQTFTLADTKGFYMTSDGLKDQLKYKTNKNKFGFKGFEEYINSNFDLAFEEQKNNIEDLYSQITRSEKQVDDILVFGFKI